MADEERGGAAGGVEGREFVDLAGVGVEVEGPVLMSLIDDGEVAGGGGGDVAGVWGLDGAGGTGLDGTTVIAGMEAVEVDLDGISLCQPLESGAGWGQGVGLGLRCGRRALHGLDDEQVGVGREDESGETALG